MNQVSLSEATEELLAHLGPVFVAAMTGASDTTIPGKWMSGLQPSRHEALSLEEGWSAWSTIKRNRGATAARDWFVSLNPLLRDHTPITAIRQGKVEDVRKAVYAFLNNA